MPKKHSSQDIVKGLATIALLKAHYDRGQDHIGMFQPFVLDVVASFDKDDFSLEDVQRGMEERHGMKVPAHTLRTLPTRARKRGHIRRAARRYFRIAGKVPVSDLPAERERLLEEHIVLAERFREFASSRGTQLATPEDSLALIWDFLESHHVAMLLESDPIESQRSVPREAAFSRSHTRLVAEFLAHVVTREREMAAILGRMLEGYVLQNALLLKDISTATRKFRNLAVYIDTGIMLGALGYRGEATRRATFESFALLRDTGAHLIVFDKTIDELRSILAVYENHLRTPQGRKSLHPTDVTRFFLTKRYTPSDIRTEISLLKRNVRALGVTIHRIPKHIPQFTWDEPGLSKRLARDAAPEIDKRVMHDVDCVAGVLTLRRGVAPESLDDAIAVFGTGSGLTVVNVTLWYRDEGGCGVPPIAHELAITNAAWLKCPTSATNLKVTQLVALCGAALSPSRRLWNEFLRHLDVLQKSGQLSSDEVTAVIASEFTDRSLAEVEEGEDADWEPDAETLSEVVERVRASYREEADAEIAAIQRERLRDQQRYVELQTKLHFLAQRIGCLVAWAVFSVFLLVLGWGLIAALIRVAPGQAGRLSVAQCVTTATMFVLSACNILFGFNVWGLRSLVQDKVTALIRKPLIEAGDGAARQEDGGEA